MVDVAGLFASSLQKEAKRCQFIDSRGTVLVTCMSAISPSSPRSTGIPEWQETGG